MIVELDLACRDSITNAFAQIRDQAGDPNVLVYNAGYLEGRDPPLEKELLEKELLEKELLEKELLEKELLEKELLEKELLEHIPFEMFETAQHISSNGPFLVVQEVLPAMPERGEGSILISNNSSSLRGKKRYTGQSLYYPRGLPRVLMRTLAQALTEEYSEYGVHVANMVIDSPIDSPGARALPFPPSRASDPHRPGRAGRLYEVIRMNRKEYLDGCWNDDGLL